MIKNNIKINFGFSILETIFYISIFIILSVVVINAMTTITKAFKETTIQTELVQGGNIMERISREIRQAYGINSITENSLKLNITDSNGVNKTTTLTFTNPNISISENDILIGNLNTQNITVTGFTFTQIDTEKGLAVKVFLTIKSNHDLLNRNENFYDTIVLRGMY